MAATKSLADAEATLLANLKPKTGKTLEEWLVTLGPSAQLKHSAVVTLLKSTHGVTHGYANIIAHKLLRSDAGSVAESGIDLIDAQYSGAKSALRAIYDGIVKTVAKFGGDVEFAPKKAYVSVRRSKQFAIIQPSTATRLDLGLNLKGVESSGRLEASGTWNAMVTHRIKLSDVKEVDAEVIRWLKQAYENA